MRSPILLLLCALFLAPASPDARGQEARWWKGNLHTHSFWSDGNDFPEMIADWYKEHGYHFLALSDHNVLSKGEKWMSAKAINDRARSDAVARYVERFGEEWVETRGEGESLEVRLRPLEEFRALFEEEGRFLMIQSEEISDSFARLPIHLNAANIQEVIPPQGGEAVADTLRNNLRAVEEQEQRTGEPILPHLNHPNFGWAFTAEDLLDVLEERFFEVFNGHTGTNNEGDSLRAGTEEIWDIVNTFRIARLGAPPLFGLAVDDSHHYHGKQHVSEPGRGWVMVRAQSLETHALIDAMERGEFYASTGVILNEVRFDAESQRISIEIEPDGDASFTTYFIGTREGFDDSHQPRARDGVPIRTTEQYSEDVGRVLASEIGLNPTYALQGDELYVRAVVVSSGDHADPHLAPMKQKAWTQPFGWRARLAQPGTGEPIRAATFNIRYDNPGDGVHAWGQRRSRVIDLIESFHADIIGLQEVTPGQYDFLREHLSEFTFIGGGRDDGERRGEASPILFRTDRFALIDHGMWWLSDTPSVPGSRGWDAALPRIATHATLRDRTTNEELLIVCTHFDHRGEKAREQSAALLAEILADEPRVLLLGDFNAVPGSIPHETLCSIFTDSADENDAATWTGFDGEPDPGRRIDWVLIKGLDALRYRVDPWRDTARPESDHLPVVVDVQ